MVVLVTGLLRKECGRCGLRDSSSEARSEGSPGLCRLPLPAPASPWKPATVLQESPGHREAGGLGFQPWEGPLHGRRLAANMRGTPGEASHPQSRVEEKNKWCRFKRRPSGVVSYPATDDGDTEQGLQAGVKILQTPFPAHLPPGSPVGPLLGRQFLLLPRCCCDHSRLPGDRQERLHRGGMVGVITLSHEDERAPTQAPPPSRSGGRARRSSPHCSRGNSSLLPDTEVMAIVFSLFLRQKKMFWMIVGSALCVGLWAHSLSGPPRGTVTVSSTVSSASGRGGCEDPGPPAC